MLWYKAWRDTRWRFLIGLVILSGTALGCVFAYPSVKGMLGVVIYGGPGDLVTQETKWMAELSANLLPATFGRSSSGTTCMVFGLCSAPCCLAQRECFPAAPAQPFTLSLPVSRRRLCAVRVATDLAELLLLALVPMLLVTIAAPAIGGSLCAGRCPGARNQYLRRRRGVLWSGVAAGHGIRGSMAAHPHCARRGHRRRGLQGPDPSAGAVHAGGRDGWRELFSDRHPGVGRTFHLGSRGGGDPLCRHTFH